MSTAYAPPVTVGGEFLSAQANSIEEDSVSIGQHEFEPALTDDQVQEYESTQNELWGSKRRLAMIALSRSKTDLVKGFGKDKRADSLFEAIDHINGWSDHLKGQIEMANAAVARLMIVASAIVHHNNDQGE